MKRTLVLMAPALYALAVVAVPVLAEGAAPNNFEELANTLVLMLDNATAALIAGGLVIYFFGISSKMLKMGHGETTDLRSYLMWGLFALFIMVSIWGILRLLQNTLFGGSGYTGGSAGSAQTCSSFGSCSFGSP